MKYSYIILILFLFSCTSKVRIKRILDGDTVITFADERLRLAEIDAPEIRQKYGIESKNYLASLILNKEVEIRRKGKDKYHRTIAKIFYAGKYVNEEMVIAGAAYVYKRFSPAYLYNEELQAKANKIGLWTLNGQISPYLFRKQFKH